LKRRDMHGDPAFIIGRAPAEQAAIAQRRLERRGVPELKSAGRLNVVMSVEQDPARSGWTSHDAVYRGMAVVYVQQFDVIESRPRQPLSRRIG
jgi:hypothetical protein